MNTKDAREFADAGDRYTGAEVRLWVHGLCDMLDAANKDAERYRWLRAQHTYDDECIDGYARWFVQAGKEPIPCDPGALDECIDAEMAATPAVCVA